MMSSQETVLVYNLKDTEEWKKLKQILLPMKVRIRMIEPSQYKQPLGALAGVKGIVSDPLISFQGEGFTEPMLFLKGFTGSRLDVLLQSMRRQQIRIPLKAVLTQENQTWNSLQLYEELRKEHLAMQKL